MIQNPEANPRPEKWTLNPKTYSTVRLETLNPKSYNSLPLEPQVTARQASVGPLQLGRFGAAAHRPGCYLVIILKAVQGFVIRYVKALLGYVKAL